MDKPASYTIIKNASLEELNTFWVPAKATYLAHIHTVEGVRKLLRDSRIQGLPLLMLGDGSNVLFTQDYYGCAVLNHLKGYHVIQEDSDTIDLKIYAGENWHELVNYTVGNGWGGLENLALIPGKVGAAPIQNIGAYGVELKDVFQELEALHLETGNIHRFCYEDCQFSYRNSVFKQSLNGQYLIVSVTLQLSKNPTPDISYKGLRQALADRAIDEPTIRDVRDVVTAIRKAKLPYPDEVGNAGSFFKNPYLSPEDFEHLIAKYPEVPHFTQQDGKVKVPAAWLIEQSGMKGVKEGAVGTHPDQPLVVVNYGGATGYQVYTMAMRVQEAVYKQFGIELQPEVRIF